MSERENLHDSSENEKSPDRLDLPFVAERHNNGIDVWNEAAAEAVKEPDYEQIVPSSEYLEFNRPRTSRSINQRLAKGKEPRHGQRRVLRRYAQYYDGYVEATDEKNAERHQVWQAGIGNMLGEAYILLTLAGEDEAREEVKQQVEDWQGGIRLTPAFGMGLLAAGEETKAKNVLLGTDTTSEMHVHNLLDAYLLTRDEDYRTSFIVHSGRRPYLLARLVYAEKEWRDPDADLLGSTHHLGAQIAVAAALSNQLPAESVAGKRVSDVLDNAVRQLNPPEKEYVTAKDRAAQAFKDEGLFGIFDAAFEGLDVLMGDSQTEHTPEYKTFLREVVPIIMVVAPLLRSSSGYVEAGFGNLARYRGKVVKALLEQSDWGNQTAAPNLLHSKQANGRSLALAYRNILRDLGPDAASQYLQYLPPSLRRNAAYHTMLRKYMLGQVELGVPLIPEFEDNYGPLEALYKQLEDLAEADAEDLSQVGHNVELRATHTGALIDMMDLGMSRPQDLKELIQAIKTIEDPKKQAELLEVLIEKLRV